MLDINEDIKQVKALKDGEKAYIYWFDEQGGKIVRDGDIYKLYEVTWMNEFYFDKGGYEDIERLVNIAYSWS